MLTNCPGEVDAMAFTLLERYMSGIVVYRDSWIGVTGRAGHALSLTFLVIILMKTGGLSVTVAFDSN